MGGDRDERGAVLALTSLGITAILIMAAIVIDLGAARAARGSSRAAADAAATAGAFELGGATTGPACRKAIAYAFDNLGGGAPTDAQVDTACNGATNGGMAVASTCAVASLERVATLTLGDRTVQVTNPVSSTSRLLLRATAVGGGVGQSFSTVPDGSAACGRIGVEITGSQARFFGGVTSSKSNSFSVHSVARYQPTGQGSPAPPAVVSLHPTACKAIDTGNGKVLVENTPDGPGTVYSDSDGTSPACSSGTGILHTGSSGALRAAALGTAPGELTWYSAPSTRGYVNGASRQEIGTTTSGSAYVGKLSSRPTRVTRSPADSIYHCTNIPPTPSTPTCTKPDPVKDAEALAQAATAPAGYTTHSAPCGTSGLPIIFLTNTFVNCPVFEVKGNPLLVTNGVTVIFKGRLDVSSGGTLAVNVVAAAAAAGTDGLPIPALPLAQSRLIVASTAADAFSISSNSSAMNLAQTFLYSKGGFSLQSTNSIRWSPPSSGPTKSLLYWSESTQPLDIQGGPSFQGAGVMFLGNASMTSGGSGLIDMSRVQLWVDKITISGSATVLLKPDVGTGISLTVAGSALVR